MRANYWHMNSQDDGNSEQVSRRRSATRMASVFVREVCVRRDALRPYSPTT